MLLMAVLIQAISCQHQCEKDEDCDGLAHQMKTLVYCGTWSWDNDTQFMCSPKSSCGGSWEGTLPNGKNGVARISCGFIRDGNWWILIVVGIFIVAAIIGVLLLNIKRK